MWARLFGTEFPHFRNEFLFRGNETRETDESRVTATLHTPMINAQTANGAIVRGDLSAPPLLCHSLSLSLLLARFIFIPRRGAAFPYQAKWSRSSIFVAKQAPMPPSPPP